MNRLFSTAMAGSFTLALISTGAMAATSASDAGSVAAKSHVKSMQLAGNTNTKKKGAKNSDSAHPTTGTATQSNGGGN